MVKIIPPILFLVSGSAVSVEVVDLARKGISGPEDFRLAKKA